MACPCATDHRMSVNLGECSGQRHGQAIKCTKWTYERPFLYGAELLEPLLCDAWAFGGAYLVLSGVQKSWLLVSTLAAISD